MALVPVCPGQGFACRPQGHNCIPESEDIASTIMTGITASFANHMCCCDFRVGAENKGG